MDKPIIKAVIIDDEEKDRESLKSKLKLYCKNIEIIAEADSVITGINVIEEYNPNLVLLDIQLTDGTGFDILKHFPDIFFKIIFITAYEHYAIKAFSFSALDYLLKPVIPEKLTEAINKTYKIINLENINKQIKVFYENFENIRNNVKKIVLNTSDNMFIISIEDIIRCESNRNYTIFYINQRKKLLVSKTLKEYDELLSPYGFFRPHKSHLVNISYINNFKKSDGGYLILNDGSSIPVSVRKREKLVKLFETF